MKDLGLFLLRVAFGGLIAVHGYPKLFGGPNKQVPPEAERYLGQGFTQSLQGGGLNNHIGLTKNLGVPAPEVMGTLSAGAEFFGGLAIVLGWRTRLAALLLLGNMGTAIGKVHWKNGLLNQGGFENPLLFAAAFLALLVAGPGKIAIDRS
jgi:putative oxidoreductase